MTAEQTFTYYEALAIRTGSNAITAVSRGNVEAAGELARNASKFAFHADPSLRVKEIRSCTTTHRCLAILDAGPWCPNTALPGWGYCSEHIEDRLTGESA